MLRNINRAKIVFLLSIEKLEKSENCFVTCSNLNFFISSFENGVQNTTMFYEFLIKVNFTKWFDVRKISSEYLNGIKLNA